ncbi:MAG TPA: hypothetical protein VJ817_16335 [Gemmatimonadales bacterium]|nr:hypothetical protein [Gemmatimonadales bacterium]
MIPAVAQLLFALLPGPPQDFSAFDACALYTLEEFAAFARDDGRRHRPTSRASNGVSTSTCWHGTRFDSLSLKIIVQRGNSPADLKMMVAALKRVAGTAPGPPAAVAGLGDEAFWGQIGPSNGQLHIVLGSDFLTVQTWGKGAGAGTLPKTLELARVIVERFRTLR